MKFLIKLSVLFALVVQVTGCGHFLKTPHEYCTTHLLEYSSYEQCYSEETSRRAAFREQWASSWSGLGNQQQAAVPTTYTPTNCTSFVNGNMIQTSCY